jgi:hypothetical protein
MEGYGLAVGIHDVDEKMVVAEWTRHLISGRANELAEEESTVAGLRRALALTGQTCGAFVRNVAFHFSGLPALRGMDYWGQRDGARLKPTFLVANS